MDWRSLRAVRAVAKAELHARLARCIPTRAAQDLLRVWPITLPAGFDLEHDLAIDTPVPSLRDFVWRDCVGAGRLRPSPARIGATSWTSPMLSPSIWTGRG